MTTRAYAPPDPALFAALVAHVRGTPDRKGEVWIACPNCGKEGRHFSFHAAEGAFCFVCGYAPPLAQLADRLGLRDRRPYSPPAPLYKRPRPPKDAPWMERSEQLAERFAAAPDAIECWRTYKPLPASAVQSYQFGVGVFPGLVFKRGERWEVCNHRRLIIPLRAGGEITGFRCRVIDCGCTKWISPSGTELPLFNGARLSAGKFQSQTDKTRAREHLLGDCHGSPVENNVVMIVENPADALLAEAQLSYAAVATLGVGIWREEWTQAFADAQPEMTVIAYDHDLPGNGASSEREHRQMVAAWSAQRPGVKPPVPGGVRLANKLLAARVPAARYPWPESTPLGYDVGELLKQETFNV